MIISLKDKIIQDSKMNEHAFDSQLKKLNQIDVLVQKTFNKISADNSSKDLQAGIKSIHEHLSENLLKRSSSTNSVDSFEFDKIALDISEIKFILKIQDERINSEAKEHRDRVSHFISMLSMLQDAHSRLAEKCQIIYDTAEIKSYINELFEAHESKLIQKINQNLSNFVPSNLESRLHDIQASLEAQRTHFSTSKNNPVNVGGIDELLIWQQDIMSRNISINEALDAMQSTISKLANNIDPSYHKKPQKDLSYEHAKKWMEDVKYLIEQHNSSFNYKVDKMEEKLNMLLKEREEIKEIALFLKKEQKTDVLKLFKSNSNRANSTESFFDLLNKPLVTRCSNIRQ